MSSPLRFEILRSLQLQGSLAYSEIMSNLELDPSRDAGKFAYHLRGVLHSGLISLDRETRKYQLTSLGKMLLAFSQEIEEQVLRKSGKLLVRTSRLTIEEFDRNRIVQALIREAGMPTELAEKISQLAEERLLKLSTKYLTAPLIREFVNAILIESGLEQYRHVLTRLGLPVYDVNQTILRSREARFDVGFVHRVAGDRVIEEYTLLNVLPREIADAHLSGQIHLCNLGNWILRPTEVSHDLRSLLNGGSKVAELGSSNGPLSKPKSLESALLLLSNLLRTSSLEVTAEQSLNYFNIILAPFVDNISPSSVERSIKNFLIATAQPRSGRALPILSLGLEFSMPSQLEVYPLIDPDGEHGVTYGDFVDESRLIAESVLKSLHSIQSGSLVQLPNFLISVGNETVNRDSPSHLLFEAHELASERNTIYFVNSALDWQDAAVYFSNGTRIGVDWSGDWELDTLRTSILDTVVLNLPRIAYQSRGIEKRFFEGLDKLVSIAIKCLNIKYQTLKDRMDHDLLPVLSSKISSEYYMRLQNSQCLISLVGLYETVSTLTGAETSEKKDMVSFASKILGDIKSLLRDDQSGSKIRIAISSTGDEVASQRLAEIDVERFGWANVKVQGTKQYPYYTYESFLPFDENMPLLDRISFEEVLHPILGGGHALTIQVSENASNPEDLIRLTSEIVGNHNLGFFNYSRNYTYCQNCHEYFDGVKQKCPSCGSASLTCYVRCRNRLVPLSWCSPTQQIHINSKQAYQIAEELKKG
ncbi:MAG: hypothetical protein JSW01_00885 [Candidatus Bathyarchaeota archaeon]|nr:MAG: hypothetical protein JSW01_00885 [Candidatus Bathyarchaeota archaeon]